VQQRHRSSIIKVLAGTALWNRRPAIKPKADLCQTVAEDRIRAPSCQLAVTFTEFLFFSTFGSVAIFPKNQRGFVAPAPTPSFLL